MFDFVVSTLFFQIRQAIRVDLAVRLDLNVPLDLTARLELNVRLDPGSYLMNCLIPQILPNELTRRVNSFYQIS